MSRLCIDMLNLRHDGNNATMKNKKSMALFASKIVVFMREPSDVQKRTTKNRYSILRY